MKIEDNLLKLYDILTKSQNIARYITYLDDDPLSQDKTDIDIDAFIDSDAIELSLFDPSTMVQETAKIFLNPAKGTFSKKPLSDIMFIIEVVIPSSKWRLANSGLRLRAFRIMDEYAKLIDGQNVAGIGEVDIRSFEIAKTDTHHILTCAILVNSVTIKGDR